MYCRIRTVSTNTLILNEDLHTNIFDQELDSTATFTLTAEQAKKLNEGQYYKIQLAFSNTVNSGDSEEIVGYFSNVGIIKCIGKPSVFMFRDPTSEESEGEDEITHLYRTDFIGIYQQNSKYGDSTEKAYSYQFVITSKKGEVLLDSGVQLHDNTQDVSSWYSTDTFRAHTGLKEGEVGYIQYTVTTLNGLVMSSKKYQIMRESSVDMDKPIRILAINNFENGYIDIKLRGVLEQRSNDPNDLGETAYSGIYVITRCDDQSDYTIWEEIARFTIPGDFPSNYSFKDFTVQQGVSYRYAIQQYNVHQVYSNRIQSLTINEWEDINDESLYRPEPTYCDFEDMFLYDGKRQLKVRFNPKVASFKNTIPEQKIETIGSKYPFIFRNGHVCYKEFPVAGLITYQMDEAVLFLTEEMELQQSGVLEPDIIRTHTFPTPTSQAIGFESKDMDGYKEEVAEAKQALDDANNNYNTLVAHYTYYKNLLKDFTNEDDQIEAITNQINLLNERYNFELIEDSNYPFLIIDENDYNTLLKEYKENIANAKTQLIILSDTSGRKNEYDITLLSDEYMQVPSGYPYNHSNKYYKKIDDTYKTYYYSTKEQWIEDVDAGLIFTPNLGLSANTTTRAGSPIVRMDKNLTSENMFSERYFKLKVLDWLTDGKVKLFRSPAEGNYLVRLLNVSLQPQDPLGRMIHSFTSTAYEIDDLTYDNLVYYGIITAMTPQLTMAQWGSLDVNKVIHYRSPNEDGFYTIIKLGEEKWKDFKCEGFAPGDIVRIYFGTEHLDVTIGTTGAFNFSDDERPITEIQVKPNPEVNIDDFSRSIYYRSTGLSRSRFDTIAAINTATQIAEQYVGPKENILEPFNLLGPEGATLAEHNIAFENKIRKAILEDKKINFYFGEGENTPIKFNLLNIEAMKVRKRIVIPIYACDNLKMDNNTKTFQVIDPEGVEIPEENAQDLRGTLFSVTPFGKGYVYNNIIYKYSNSQGIYSMIPKNGLDKVQLYPVAEIDEVLRLLPEFNYEGYSILQVFVPDIKFDAQNNPVAFDWKINPQSGRKYFDTFTGQWWDEGIEYDPTFEVNSNTNTPKLKYLDFDSVNDSIINSSMSVFGDPNDFSNYTIIDNDECNIIRMDYIDELNFKNVGIPEKLRLGNGLMMELTFRMQTVDYDIEVVDSYTTYGYRRSYLAEKEDFSNKLHSFMENATIMGEKVARYNELQGELENSTELILEYRKIIEQISVLKEAYYGKLMNAIQIFYRNQNKLISNEVDSTDPDYLNKVGLEELMQNKDISCFPSSFNNLTTSIWEQQRIVNDGETNTEISYEDLYNNEENSLIWMTDDNGKHSRSYYYDEAEQKWNNNLFNFADDDVVAPNNDPRRNIITILANEDVCYNTRLNYFREALEQAKVKVDNLRATLSTIPSTISTYGEYRTWLKEECINPLAEMLYAYLHKWDSLEEDLDDINYANPAKIDAYSQIFLMPKALEDENSTLWMLLRDNTANVQYNWQEDDAYKDLILPEIASYQKIVDDVPQVDENGNPIYDYEAYEQAILKTLGLLIKKDENGIEVLDDANVQVWQNFNGYLVNAEDKDEKYPNLLVTSKNDIRNKFNVLLMTREEYTMKANDYKTFFDINATTLENITIWEEQRLTKLNLQEKYQNQLIATEILLSEKDSNLSPEKRKSLQDLKESLTILLEDLLLDIKALNESLSRYHDLIQQRDIVVANYNFATTALSAAQSEFDQSITGYTDSLSTYVNLLINTDIKEPGLLSLLYQYRSTLNKRNSEEFEAKNTYQALDRFDDFYNIIIQRINDMTLEENNSYANQANDSYLIDFDLWNDLKTYTSQYTNEEKTGKLDKELVKKENIETEMRELQRWVDLNKEGFDEKSYINQIVDSLVRYLSYLGIEYRLEIKERYNI